MGLLDFAANIGANLFHSEEEASELFHRARSRVLRDSIGRFTFCDSQEILR